MEPVTDMPSKMAKRWRAFHISLSLVQLLHLKAAIYDISYEISREIKVDFLLMWSDQTKC